MVYRRFYDAKAFYDAVYPVLLRHEAQNSLPLGNVVLGNGGGEPDGWKNVKNRIMAAVYGGNGEVLLTAIMTPPYFRNKGYAGSCVAQLSQRILDEGYRYVSLFTDLANPTSNSIYQKIGYQPVCDYEQISFQRE